MKSSHYAFIIENFSLYYGEVIKEKLHSLLMSLLRRITSESIEYFPEQNENDKFTLINADYIYIFTTQKNINFFVYKLKL